MKMNEDASPTELVQRLRQGDPQATDELFARYSLRLSRLAEQHLSRKLAGRVEGDDVVQSVFRTFFRRVSTGDFQIDGAGQLWHLLVKITVRKAQAQGRRHTAAVRDVRLQQPDGETDWLAELASREPAPEDAAILIDQIEALLQGLPEIYRQVLEQRLQGQSATEIAANLGVARRTVYRTLEVLQKRLETPL
jgi:RNA polymerase sigma-70 factor, ECF subfamily